MSKIGKFFWKLGCPETPTRMNIVFTFITETGYEILTHTLTDVIIPKQLRRKVHAGVTGEHDEWRYGLWLEKQDRITTELNQMALVYLKEEQVKKYIKTTIGALQTGNYIVKAVWDITDVYAYEPISYEERKNFEW